VVHNGALDVARPSNIRVVSGLGSSQESSFQAESKCERDSQGVSGVSSSGNSDMCMTCVMNPKNGIFVHGKVGHICCCYKCALKVWTQLRRCPVCNCKVNNVLKAIILWNWTVLQFTLHSHSYCLLNWSLLFEKFHFLVAVKITHMHLLISHYDTVKWLAVC
jgi:hypothetical protein